MNRKKAKEMAQDNKMTWRELIKMIDDHQPKGKSKVNPSLTQKDTLKLLRDSICGRDMNEVPMGKSYSITREQITISRDGMKIANILMECL